MKFADEMLTTILHKTRVGAGKNSLNRDIRCGHLVDMPDLLPAIGSIMSHLVDFVCQRDLLSPSYCDGLQSTGINILEVEA